MPTTTKQKKLIIMVTALILVSAVIFFMSRRDEDDHEGKVFLHVVSFSVPGGWGYNILSEEKVFIHQPQIPAIAGRHPFRNEQDALKTGRLVIQKISHNQMPSVTARELDSLGVSWK